MALVARVEREAIEIDGPLSFAGRSEVRTNVAADVIAQEIARNVARGHCVLCGGKGGDHINPGDPCPLCGKERGR